MAVNDRQARAEATRAQLLEAARQVFADRGYKGATVAAITEHAATAHGTFYLYFRNKEDILLEIARGAFEDLYQHSFTPLDELPVQPDLGVLRERIAGFLVAFAQHGPIWRSVFEAVLSSEAAEHQWLGLRRRFHDALAVRFRRLVDHGVIAEIDDVTVAHALASMLEWHAFTGVVFHEPAPFDPAPGMIETLAQIWERALGLPGAAPPA